MLPPGKTPAAEKAAARKLKIWRTVKITCEFIEDAGGNGYIGTRLAGTLFSLCVLLTEGRKATFEQSYIVGLAFMLLAVGSLSSCVKSSGKKKETSKKNINCSQDQDSAYHAIEGNSGKEVEVSILSNEAVDVIDDSCEEEKQQLSKCEKVMSVVQEANKILGKGGIGLGLFDLFLDYLRKDIEEMSPWIGLVTVATAMFFGVTYHKAQNVTVEAQLEENKNQRYKNIGK